MRSILDKDFKYVPSHSTDISKTFAKHRKAQAAAIEQHRRAQEQATANTQAVVRVFNQRKAKP